jgi:hypothetical protein
MGGLTRHRDPLFSRRHSRSSPSFHSFSAIASSGEHRYSQYHQYLGQEAYSGHSELEYHDSKVVEYAMAFCLAGNDKEDRIPVLVNRKQCLRNKPLQQEMPDSRTGNAPAHNGCPAMLSIYMATCRIQNNHSTVVHNSFRTTHSPNYYPSPTNTYPVMPPNPNPDAIHRPKPCLPCIRLLAEDPTNFCERIEGKAQAHHHRDGHQNHICRKPPRTYVSS